MRRYFPLSLGLAALMFSGCAGGSSGIPNAGGGSNAGGSNPSVPLPPVPAVQAKLTMRVHVPSSASASKSKSARSKDGRVKPDWVSPSSDTIVLDVAGLNGVAGSQSYTQYQSLSTGTNCTPDPSGNGIDCTVVMNNVPVGNDFFRITTTDHTQSGSAPANIQPVAADGKTLLGPALSQNFVAATVVNSATSNCDSGSGPIVNCVGVTLDAIVYHPAGPSVNTTSTTMPSGAPAAQGYYVYVGFSDYDNNLIFGGGGGDGNIGDTAVYTTPAQGFANNEQGQTLDTLYVSSSAQPIVLTDYGTTTILQSTSPVSTTRINYNEYVVPTSGASTTVCAWDIPAGILGTSATQCASTTFSPPSAPITIIIN